MCSSTFDRPAAAAACAALALTAAAAAGTLSVLSVQPPNARMTAPPAAPIVVTFDRPVHADTVHPGSFSVFGKISGLATGAFVFAEDGATVAFVPDQPFVAGETVLVNLSRDIAAADGAPLRAAGYAWRFVTRSRPALLALEKVDVVPSGQPGESTTPYGGSACDLNEDGWADVAIVNEDTDDVRVFLNAADASSLLTPYLLPTSPVGSVPSPSETADFDRDGHIDLVVANTQGASISVLLGDGAGGFGRQQIIPLNGNPRGLAVLDVDGDGDLDVAAASHGGSSLALAINDGTGGFGPASFFEGGGAGEWSLLAADMNNDGVGDLVTGTSSGQVIVRLGNGDGTFQPPMVQNAVGHVWMLVCGDLDGDGWEDVASAESSSNKGGIYFNAADGSGALAPPVSYTVDPFPLATDVADLDGDGDMDWVISSFSGDWRVFRNDGAGSFSLLQELPSTIAASCAVPVDLDNDRDMDLVLIDEIADELVIVRNSGFTPPGDLDLDGAVGGADLGALLAEWGRAGDLLAADLDGDGTVGGSDLGILLGSWSERR